MSDIFRVDDPEDEWQEWDEYDKLTLPFVPYPTIPYPQPNVPYPTAPYPNPVMTNKCPKCGLELSNVMMYVCMDPYCPVGLGGTLC